MNKHDYFLKLLDDNYDPELAAIMADIYDNLNYYSSNYNGEELEDYDCGYYEDGNPIGG